MNEERIEFEVNGQTLSARPGTMLIEATDAAGITIPRFCYHHKLSVAANCRMCLVEVERSAKPLPACATPVSAGMKVWTRSEKALAAQKDVMEFLLINHPLDCPICDQGGECELQDVSMGFGNSRSHFAEMKRVVRDKDIGPLIETAMTRCIHCTRCVRFGEEIAGLRELGATGRSQYMEIGTFIEKSLASELSGNVIDLCPVGALTAKPSRYTARAWEMRSHDSIAPHDAVGSNIAVHTFDGRVVRVVPRENDEVNECWISDRDRFSYEGLNSPERIGKPQVKQDGKWQEVSWQQALDTVAAILGGASPGDIGALAAPGATLEELFLLQKLMRSLGCHNIDSRLRQVDVSDQVRIPPLPGLGMSFQALEQQQVVLLVGSNVRQELPLLNHRLRKAVLAGAQVMAINPRRVAFNYPVEQTVAAPLEMPAVLLRLLVAVCEHLDCAPPEIVAELCAGVHADEASRRMAQQLCTSGDTAVLLGQMAIQHPALSVLRMLGQTIANLSGAKFGYLPEAGAVSGCLAGALPHRGAGGVTLDTPGMACHAMLSAGLATYVLLHAEADDFADPQLARQAFAAASQVIVIAPFASSQTREFASVLLPAAAFTETSGTHVNAEGRRQGFKGVARPLAEARPAWKILRVLGNLLKLPEFDYMSSEEVAAELQLEAQGLQVENAYVPKTVVSLPDSAVDGWQRIGDVHMYGSDALVRRATALQATVAAPVVRLHPADMAQLGLHSGDLVQLEQGGSVQLPAEADADVPAGCVWLQAGTPDVQALGAAFGSIRVSRV